MKTTIFIKSIIKLLYMKIIFKQIISILLISTILGVFNNYFISNNRVDLIKYQRSVDTVIEGDFSIPDLMIEPQIVKTDFIKYYIDNSTTTIIDARDQEQYDELHIKGSINIPYNSYEDSDILYELPVEDIYIIYCNGGDCTLSLDLAYVMFEEFDFETVFVYEEGIPVWENKGYSLSSNIHDAADNNKDTEINELDIWKWASVLLGIFYIIFIINTIKNNIDSWRKACNTIAVVSFRLILGYVFIYASIQKIVNPLEFSNQIDLYQATPLIINNLVALIIPWVELLIGLGLIFNRQIKGSIVLSIFLLIIFIILLSQAYYRGISLDCGCFGSAEPKSDLQLSKDMLIRIRDDIIFLCMSLYLYFIYLFKSKEYAN